MLAPKTCMKFIIKRYRSWDVDDHKFVVRTVNRLPHARFLLFLEQSLVLKGGSDISSCHSPASISAQFHSLWLFWKYWYQRNFALITCGPCNFSPCLWRLKSRTVLTLYYSLFFFLASISEFLKIFTRREKVPRMVPSIAQLVFVTSPKAFERASTSYSMACMWSFG
jgi:hypothetical protein